MAHGFVSYSKPNPSLNLPSLIAGKVKDAAGMAAEERKAREKEIQELKKKEQDNTITAQEVDRLNDLEAKDAARKQPGLKGVKNSFFAKAMMSQFGGDRRRRIQGTFSRSPGASRDPSLSKEERFSALLDESARPAEEPLAPVDPGSDDDLDGMDYGDAGAQVATPQQSTLEKILSMVSSSYDMIAAKVSSLGAEEKKSIGKNEETNARLSRFAGVFESIKNYFDKDNDLKKKEGEIEKEKIDNFRQSEEEAQVKAESNSIKSTEDLSKFEDQYQPEEKEEDSGGGLLDGLFKFLGGKEKGSGKTSGGITPQSKAYSGRIGPQPMNSATPWAAKGPGDRGGMFGQGGFTPRLPAKKLSSGGVVPVEKAQKSIGNKPPKKLAGGGIYDNPTTTRLNPGDAVIPLNRNNALADTFKRSKAQKGSTGKSETQTMGQLLQLVTQVGGGLLLTKMSSVLGGMSNVLKPIFSSIATPIVSAFGLPTTIVGSLFGGPAAAATLPFDIDSFLGNKESKGSGGSKGGPKGGGGGTPSPTGGADLGSSMRAGETIQAQAATDPGGFIQGGSGLGSEGGQNTNKGYATHYHLSPPTNDPAGWAEARSVALTSAQMMLNRGSTVYFGNIKEHARPEDLADQIAREQQAHTQPGRTQGGIDMQEKSSDGSMRMKFPLKVTNVTQDINSGSGRTARIIGTNVRLAHGAVGSANSVETAAAPPATNQPPISLGSNPSQSPAGAPAGTPVTPAPPGLSDEQSQFLAIMAPRAAQEKPQDVPITTPNQFPLYNPAPGFSSLYQFQY